MPLFSVVIPTYNRAVLLPETIERVLNQDFEDYELIIVDDGSDDNTAEVLATYRGSLRVMYQDNQGPASARNLGASIAAGKYLAFLDSDDVWFPWTLDLYSKAIGLYGNPTIVNGKILEFWNLDKISCERCAELRAEYYDDYYEASARGYFAGAGKCVVLKSAFEEIEGFTNVRFNCEDHDLIMRLGTANGYVQILEPTMVGWRRHHASETGDLVKTVAGAHSLVKQELMDGYPGGRARCWERRRIITLHTRPISIEIARRGKFREAMRLYFATVVWHMYLGRWKYCLGFPVVIIRACLEFVLDRAKSSPNSSPAGLESG